MMGSGVFCGAFSLETAYAARDVDGKSVGEELRASATRANRRRATIRSAPISRPTSSRARCWKMRTR
jgi:hypothetical protein